MDRALDQFYQFALVLTLWITGLGLGMSYGPSQILRTLRRGGLFARAVLLDVVIVPLLIWGLVQAFSVPDRSATGLLLVGMASGGRWGSRPPSSPAPIFPMPSPWSWSWRPPTWLPFPCGWG